MPTNFLIGKKGGGKTLRAMMLMEKEFVDTRRTVVTNLPVHYERFREYLVQKHGQDFDFRKRMVMLTTAQTAQFWLYYGLDFVEYVPFENLPPAEQLRERKRAAHKREEPEGKYITHPKKITGKKYQFDANDTNGTKQYVPDFAEREGSPSVHYFLDEIHLTFNSRKWTATGTDALYYISLERHFGDDQTLCTQCFGNVDKQLRSMGQEYIHCTNHKKLSMAGTFGLVKRPLEFTASHYPDQPTPTLDPLKVVPFGLDKDGIASCYRTVASSEFGVGNDEADKGKLPQGGKIPFSVMIVAGMLLCVGGVYAMSKVGNWFITRGASGASKAYAAASSHGSGAATNAPAPAVVAAQSERLASQNSMGAVAPAVEAGFLTGVAFVRGHLMIFLSDGRQFTDSDRGVRLLRGLTGDVRAVEVSGQVYGWRQRPRIAGQYE